MKIETIIEKVKQKLIKKIDQEIRSIEEEAHGLELERAKLEVRIKELEEEIKALEETKRRNQNMIAVIEELITGKDLFIDYGINVSSTRSIDDVIAEIRVKIEEEKQKAEAIREKSKTAEGIALKENEKEIYKRLSRLYGTKFKVLLGQTKHFLKHRERIQKDLIQANMQPADFDALDEYFNDYLCALERHEFDARNLGEMINWLERIRKPFEDEISDDLLREAIEGLGEDGKDPEELEKKLEEKNRELKSKKKELKKIKSKIIGSKTKEKVSKKEKEKEEIQSKEKLEELGLTRQEAVELLDLVLLDYLVVPVPHEVTNKNELFNYEKEEELLVDDNRLRISYRSNILRGSINSNDAISHETSALLIPLKDIKPENITSISKDGIIEIESATLPKGTKVITIDSKDQRMFLDFDCFLFAQNKKLSKAVNKFLNETSIETDITDYSIFPNISNAKSKEVTVEDVRKWAIIYQTVLSNFVGIYDKTIKVSGEEYNLESNLIRILKYQDLDVLFSELEQVGIDVPEHIKNMLIQMKEDGGRILESGFREELKGSGITREKRGLLSQIYEESVTRKDDEEKKSIGSFEKVLEIEEKIDAFIDDPKNNIEEIYRDLLNIYLGENSRARQHYNEEKSTRINISGVSLNIKPNIPQTDEELKEILFRKKEDKTYKIIRTAALCNKLAHSYESIIKRSITEKAFANEGTKKFHRMMYGDMLSGDKELDNLIKKKVILFQLKTKLSKLAIERMKKDPEKYSFGKVSDNRGRGVAFDMPGYSTIVLHFPETDDITEGLQQYKFAGGQLQTYSKEDTLEGVITSAITVSGINKNLVEQLMKMTPRERKGFFTRLNNVELQNILVRLGYTSKNFGTAEVRLKVINEIVRDDVIKKILEDDELCR